MILFILLCTQLAHIPLIMTIALQCQYTVVRINGMQQQLISCPIFIKYAGGQKAVTHNTRDTEPAPAPDDYGGFELSPNPAYGTVEFVSVQSGSSRDGETQPAMNDAGTVPAPTEGQPPGYENLEMLY